MTVFEEKLDRLTETISLVEACDTSALASALRAGRGRTVVAIGSGGSAVAAEYFSRCRSTLALGPTSVQTPMEFVTENIDRSSSEIWLF